MDRSSRRALAALVCLVLLLTGCASADTSDETTTAGGPQIVVTTTILGDLVTQLVDGRAGVDVLLPRGADTHGFAPSAAQAGSLLTADLIVANGLGLEEGLLDAIGAAEEEGVPVLRVADVVSPPADEDEPHEDEEHEDEPHEDEEHGEEDHDHGDGDPHVWFDPELMAAAVEEIAGVLAELGLDATDMAGSLTTELEALDDELRDVLADIPDDRRVLVTNHDSLGRLADAYDLEIAGTVIPGGSTLAEPSSADLDDLVATIVERDVQAIFVDASSPTALADAVADEVGRDIAVVSLLTESLAEPGEPGDTYQSFMRVNVQRIADALRA